MVSLQRSSPKIKLSAQELRDISQDVSKGFAPIFDNPGFNTQVTSSVSKLSPKELCNISVEISREFTPNRFIEKTQKEAKLVLLPIAPGHLQAYWQDIRTDIDIPSEQEAKPQLTLRLFEQDKDFAQVVSWHDIVVEPTQEQQEIHVPVLTSDIVYSAVIGEYYDDGQFITFAGSSFVDAHQSTAVSYDAMALHNGSKNVVKNASGLGICRAS